MKSGISRRQFHAVLGWGVASIALSEFGLAHRSVAEENFSLASTGQPGAKACGPRLSTGPNSRTRPVSRLPRSSRSIQI
jgi:hypothetical protein